jgi:hypothetical protein
MTNTRAAAAPSAVPAPYPQSRLGRLVWDDQLIRRGDGGSGDNWAMTWTGQDMLFAAYGDGYAMNLGAPKLTLGFAVVSGEPPDHEVRNFPTDLDTPMGGGRNGIKASGILMVEGTLYLFFRNFKVDGDYRHSRLAWSRDGGHTWQLAEWHFGESFGCPELIQFGPDYAGARDGYVYVVSQDGNDAYEYEPGIVLARVPKAEVANRAAYEFFAGMDGASPAWSREISDRKPVFEDPAGTHRISVTYNAPLDRYLLTSSHRSGRVDMPGDKSFGTIHHRSLGVFDAPEPWGPWTTLYYSQEWTEALTFHHKFPTKWMSPDGRGLWLAFSGRNIPERQGDPDAIFNCLMARRARLAKG